MDAAFCSANRRKHKIMNSILKLTPRRHADFYKATVISRPFGIRLKSGHNFKYRRHILKSADKIKTHPNLKKLKALLEKRGMLRVRDLPSLGFPNSYLGELAARGYARRQTRGLYVHPEADIPAHYSLAIACSKVPQGVICLLSALSYHNIGTQNPHEVWMAIDRKSRHPKLEYPRLRIARFSGEALEAGVETVTGAFPIRVYSPAKTIADCFKYRQKIGVDVAVEALKEGWRERRFTMAELSRYARICRVKKVMAPYLEAIL